MTDVATTDDAEKTAGRLPRWLWVVFICSVALNLLVVGSFIGMHFSGHDHDRRGVRGLLWNLPDDQRKEVGGILRAHHAEVRPLRRDLRKQRQDLVDYLRQDKIERGELERRLIALEQQQQNIRVKLRPMMLTLAEKLGPEERARVMRRFLGGRRSGHRGGRRWWRHRPE